VEVKKVIHAVGFLKFFSPRTNLVDEVGDSFDWISDPGISRVLGGVGGVVGIELLPLAINLPLESLSLCISLFF